MPDQVRESWIDGLSDEDLVRYGRTREELRYMDGWIARLYEHIASMERAKIVGYLRAIAAHYPTSGVPYQVLVEVARRIEVGEMDPTTPLALDRAE